MTESYIDRSLFLKATEGKGDVIKTIKRMDSPVIPDEASEVQEKESDCPVSIYIRDGTLYISSEADTIKAPMDCSSLFEGWTELEDIEGIREWDFSDTEDLSDMFRDCASLGDLSDVRWDTSAVSDMHGMFEGCPELSNPPKLKTGHARDFSRMFRESGIRAVPDFDMYKASDCSMMFAGCLYLADMRTFYSWNIRDANLDGIFDDTPAKEEYDRFLGNEQDPDGY